MNKKDLYVIESALSVLESSPKESVFQLSQKLVDRWINLKLFSPLKDKNFPDFKYSLTHKSRKYLLKQLDNECFILCHRSIVSKAFSQLNKLSEVKKVVKIIYLEETLKQKVVDKEKAFKKSKDSTNLTWNYSIPALFHLFSFKELNFKEQREIKNFFYLSWSAENQLSDSQGKGIYVYQEDYEEFALEVQKHLKKKERGVKESVNLSSPFESPEDLFSNISFSGAGDSSDSDQKPDGKEILFESEEESENEIQKKLRDNLIELLPTPMDSYKELISNLPREKMRARYFNPNFPISSVVELNNSYHFWALISPQYQDVEGFWIKLKNFYCSLSAYEIEQLINSQEFTPKHIWLQIQQKTTLNSYDSKSNSFKEILDNKLEGLQSKNEQLTSQLNVLRENLLKQGKYPDTDLLYLQSMREKKKLLEEIENTFKVLRNYSDKLKQYSEKHPEFSPNFYLSIFGSNSILTKYDSLVCDAFLDLNEQINEIVFYQQEVERLLFERLSALHQARKAEMKLEFLEKDDSLSKLVFAQQKSIDQRNRAEELKRLEIQGALELTKNTIQKEIEEEKFKLSNYLDRLQQLDYYPDFEEQSQHLRSQKAAHRKKIEEYRGEIYGLKLKAELIEQKYNSFITAIREQILEFQKEISDIYSGHLSLIHSSINQVWEDWTNEGIGHIERILARKKELIKEFSEIIVLELKNMYLNQDNLLEESRARKKEWERVYQEMVDEFKTLGYFLETPKPSENYHKYLPKMDKSLFNLSPEMQKLIYYRPNFKYTKPKVNELIGLSPRLLNDDEFLVIDQVWTKLTPIQEHKLREKIAKESNEKEKEKLEELIQKAQDDLYKRLEAKNYKFKTLTIEKDFPQEVDEEERYKKLKAFEKASFHNWKEMHFTSSELRYKFKDMLTHLSKKLFTLKEVEPWGDQINITDKGKLEDPSIVEKLSEFDYFVKTSEKLSLVDSCPLSSFKAEETDLYDLEDEDYLSILEALDEGHTSFRAQPKKGLIPKLDDWSKLNLKKYREEKKKVDITEIKEGLQSLEKEIQTLQKVSGNYREACEMERNRRELLFSEMKENLNDLRKYLEKEEDELNKIFADTSDMIDLNFEELDRRLEARRKLIAEIKESRGNI
ncbi:coiled-coil domain-containing protein [Mycoplasma ovis]|uniref:hypothetical protein n=1 Tax=Mycoplasma ovis TaxID=171632 RepID=UPI0004240933